MNARQQKALFDLHVGAEEYQMAESMSPGVLDKFITNKAAYLGHELGMPRWLNASPEAVAGILSHPSQQLHEAAFDGEREAGREALRHVGLLRRQSGLGEMGDGELWSLLEGVVERAEWHLAEARRLVPWEATPHRQAAEALRLDAVNHLETLRERGALGDDGASPTSDAVDLEALGLQTKSSVPAVPTREDSGRFAADGVPVHDPTLLQASPEHVSQAVQHLRDLGRVRVAGQGGLSDTLAKHLAQRIEAPTAVTPVTVNGTPFTELKLIGAVPDVAPKVMDPDQALAEAGVHLVGFTRVPVGRDSGAALSPQAALATSGVPLRKHS